MALSIKASLLFKPVAQLSMSVPWGIQPPGDLWVRPKCLKSFIDAFITQFLLLDRRVAFSKPHWPRPPLLGNAGCAAGSQHCLPLCGGEDSISETAQTELSRAGLMPSDCCGVVTDETPL